MSAVDHLIQIHIIVFGAIGFFIISIYVIAITYDITKKAIFKFHSKDDPESGDQTSMDLVILIYSNLFLICIHMIILLFRFIFPFDSNICDSINIVSIIAFQLTRTVMLVIYIRRIQNIFSDTLFNSHKKYAFMLYILTLIHFILPVFYFNWDKRIQPHSEFDQQFGCFLVYKSQIILIVLLASLLDITISIGCLYLFVSPLYKLIIHQDDEQIKNQLFNIIIKISILYGTTIISFIIFTLLKVLTPFGFYYGIIDGLMNGMLLILLHPMHNNSYRNICCALHKCCIKLCNIFHDANYNKKTIQQNEQFKLKPQPISVVLENTGHSSKNKSPTNVPPNKPTIKETDSQQTPVNILVAQSIVHIKPNNNTGTQRPSAFGAFVNDLMINEQTQVDTTTETPIDTAYMSPQSVTYTVSIKDPRKTSNDDEIKQTENNNSGTPSSVKSQIELKSKRSNTLKLINYESTYL